MAKEAVTCYFAYWKGYIIRICFVTIWYEC